MITVIIGDVVGMSHETPYTLDGRPVLCHRPHRAVTTPAEQFHARSGTIHQMRPYVVEYANKIEALRYRWTSRCGQFSLAVEATGVCRANRVTTSWVIVTFGEHQVMTQLIAKRVFITPADSHAWTRVRPPRGPQRTRVVGGACPRPLWAPLGSLGT
jgi:hypothetical protein